jgi:hypothetical protein
VEKLKQAIAAAEKISHARLEDDANIDFSLRLRCKYLIGKMYHKLLAIEGYGGGRIALVTADVLRLKFVSEESTRRLG